MRRASFLLLAALMIAFFASMSSPLGAQGDRAKEAGPREKAITLKPGARLKFVGPNAVEITYSRRPVPRSDGSIVCVCTGNAGSCDFHVGGSSMSCHRGSCAGECELHISLP